MSAISPKEANKDRTSLALDPSKHANQDNIRGQQKSGCCWIILIKRFLLII